MIFPNLEIHDLLFWIQGSSCYPCYVTTVDVSTLWKRGAELIFEVAFEVTWQRAGWSSSAIQIKGCHYMGTVLILATTDYHQAIVWKKVLRKNSLWDCTLSKVFYFGKITVSTPNYKYCTCVKSILLKFSGTHFLQPCLQAPVSLHKACPLPVYWLKNLIGQRKRGRKICLPRHQWLFAITIQSTSNQKGKTVGYSGVLRWWQGLLLRQMDKCREQTWAETAC